MIAPTPSRHGLYLRLASFYGAFFLMAGLMMPYWPLWLASRGLGATEIGLVLSAGYWTKVVAQPLVARRADRIGETRGLMVALAAAALVILAAFDRASGFWTLVFLAALLGMVHQPVLPLGESTTLRRARTAGLDYGRIRLWGSITFILASVIGGVWLQRFAAGSFLWLIFGAQALLVVACIAMPSSAREPSPVRLVEVLRLVLQRRFALFLLVTGSIQASHVIVYGFGALYWQRNGMPESTIGLLWSAGVVAEIALFAWIGRYRRRPTYVALLVLGAAGGLVRWPLTALTLDPILLIPIQCLHALTFGATHLAAMAYLSEAVPDRLAATGQALYAALVGGVAMGLALPAGAWLFARVDGQAFLAMGVLCAVGLAGALALGRAQVPGETPPSG